MAALARAWVFTWNNPPDDAYDQFTARRADISVLNIGREVGASGTPHLQGHLVLRRPARLAALHRWFPNVHFEVRRGSEQQAREYTEKEGDPDRLDWDDRHQGQRSDLTALTALVQANPRIGVRSAASQMPTAYVKYHAGVRALALALLPLPPMVCPRNVRWFFGPTGTGKSYTALQEALAATPDESNVFRWTLHNLKFAGDYTGQQFVVLDELRSDWEHFTFARLLTILDAYRCEVEVKNGQAPWCATDIWVTTPLHPDDFITDAERRGNPQAVQQLRRRIREVRQFDVAYVPAPPPSPGPLPSYFCADSDAERDSPVLLPVVGTPPLPRAVFAPLSDDTDSDADAARLLSRRLERVPLLPPGSRRGPAVVDLSSE